MSFDALQFIIFIIIIVIISIIIIIISSNCVFKRERVGEVFSPFYFFLSPFIC